MFKFVKQKFILAMMFFSRNLPGVNSLSCISIKNQECKVRPEIINVNSNQPVFYPSVLKQVNVVAVVIIKLSICKNMCSKCYKRFKR